MTAHSSAVNQFNVLCFRLLDQLTKVTIRIIHKTQKKLITLALVLIASVLILCGGEEFDIVSAGGAVRANTKYELKAMGGGTSSYKSVHQIWPPAGTRQPDRGTPQDHLLKRF